jgi:hypothetical protein
MQVLTIVAYDTDPTRHRLQDNSARAAQNFPTYIDYNPHGISIVA